MNRDALNLYLEGFLGLADEKASARLLLIQEARSASSVIELLQEWAWLQNWDHQNALKVKLWFQLSYAELSEIFGLSLREITQLLRNQRLSLLPVYRPEKVRNDEELSCFMVEQHLSPWIDGEIVDATTIEAVGKHLKSCGDCHRRLEQFRDLQGMILSDRTKAGEVSEEEWLTALTFFKMENRKRIFKGIIFGTIILATSALLVWAIFSKPEKMPNVYENHD